MWFHSEAAYAAAHSVARAVESKCSLEAAYAAAHVMAMRFELRKTLEAAYAAAHRSS